MLKILTVIDRVLELTPVINTLLSLFGWTRAQKQVRKVSSVLNSVVNGVQSFRESQPREIANSLKHCIRDSAVVAKTQTALGPIVKTIKDIRKTLKQ